MAVQQKLELDLKSNKADDLLLVLVLSSPISANMSCYRWNCHQSGHPGTFMLGIGDARASLCLGSTGCAGSVRKKGKGSRNGRWILLWWWGEAGYSCLTKEFGHYCTRLNGKRGDMFCFSGKGMIYLSPWLFFSVQWLLHLVKLPK